MNDKINKKDYKDLTYFKRWTLENFPFIEADFDAITNYQLYCKIVEYLNNVIYNQNQVQDLSNELVDGYNNLVDYVNDFFDTVNLQEEVNNKLDEMVEAGTITALFNLYPTKENEIGVINNMFPYGDVMRYGAKCDGTTDDKDALNTAITNALLFKCPVYIHGLLYVSETINVHGVKIIGDKQPTNPGVNYPNGIGWDYPKNVGEGADITWSDYVNDICEDSSIISDIANPILETEYNEPFNFENCGVYGWLRNNTQEGLYVKSAPDNVTYYPGGHKFDHFSVFNIGLNAIHLHSLELATINNLIIELCNGYGLYIEGLDGKDTPFDYNKIENSRFRYTRLSAIYVYKSARVTNEINHCNFNYIGQYGFGHVNDIYGDRTHPDNNDDIIYAIEINSPDPTGTGQLRELHLTNNYGEQTSGLLKVHNFSTITGFTMHGNNNIKAVDSTNSVYAYIHTTYLLNIDVDYTPANVETLYDINSNISQIHSQSFIPNQLMEVIKTLGITKYYTTTSQQGSKAFKSMYGDSINMKSYLIGGNNYYYFNSSSSSSQELTIDITTYVDTYFSTNWSTTTGQPFTLALLSLSNGGNSSASPVCDLIAITRHNSKHFITFITNNTGATADTNGVITITVPAYKIATLQFIQQVESAVGNK